MQGVLSRFLIKHLQNDDLPIPLSNKLKNHERIKILLVDEIRTQCFFHR